MSNLARAKCKTSEEILAFLREQILLQSMPSKDIQ
jgi:hypothetical protein